VATRGVQSVLLPEYGLDNWRIVVWFLAQARYFFSTELSIQTASGLHPASYSTGTVGSFPEKKVVSACNLPLTSIYCWRYNEWRIDLPLALLSYLYLHSTFSPCGGSHGWESGVDVFHIIIMNLISNYMSKFNFVIRVSFIL